MPLQALGKHRLESGHGVLLGERVGHAGGEGFVLEAYRNEAFEPDPQGGDVCVICGVRKDLILYLSNSQLGLAPRSAKKPRRMGPPILRHRATPRARAIPVAPMVGLSRSFCEGSLVGCRHAVRGLESPPLCRVAERSKGGGSDPYRPHQRLSIY